MATIKSTKRATPAAAATIKPATRIPTRRATTKSETILTLLRRTRGATVAEMASVAGWQEHSVRGFLSGELKRKRGLTVTSERIDGALRYRLAKGA